MIQPGEVKVQGASVVQTRSYGSAQEYLEALHPLADWAPRDASWIFRGHGDAGWKLLPSAHRSQALNAYGGPYDPSQVRLREGRPLRQFFKAAERGGLEIPVLAGASF